MDIAGGKRQSYRVSVQILPHELLEKWHRMQKKLPYRLESKAWHESLLQRFCGRIYAQVRFHRMLHNIRGKRELFYPDPKT